MGEMVPRETAREVRLMVWAALLKAGHSHDAAANLVLPEQRDRLVAEFGDPVTE